MGSDALAAASWQCQWCSHTNSAENNKRCCFSCRGWRDGIAPSTSGIAIPKEKAGRGRPRLSVTTGDAPMLETCDDGMTEDMPTQEICNDPTTHHPGAIILRAPRPHSDMALLSMGSHHFTDKNDAPNGASPCKGDRPT